MFGQTGHFVLQSFKKLRDVQPIGQRVVDQQRDRQTEPALVQLIFAPRDARVAVGGDRRRLRDGGVMQLRDRGQEQQTECIFPVIDAAVCNGFGLAALRFRQKCGKLLHRVQRTVGIAAVGAENRVGRIAVVELYDAAVQDALPQRWDSVGRAARTPDHRQRKVF